MQFLWYHILYSAKSVHLNNELSSQSSGLLE